MSSQNFSTQEMQTAEYVSSVFHIIVGIIVLIYGMMKSNNISIFIGALLILIGIVSIILTYKNSVSFSTFNILGCISFLLLVGTIVYNCMRN